ncbi:MAG: phosphate ABC transporter substrate-binding protein [Bacillota bacterium]
MRKMFNKSTILLMALIVLTAMTLLTGCGQPGSKDAPQEPAKDDQGKAALSGTVTIAGSTSVQPLSEELAAAFMSIHPGVRIEVSGGGSGAGVKAAQTGAADIGAASRALKSDETGVIGQAIAVDGIAVIVHPSNPIDDISFEILQKIFRGEITDWNQVGGQKSGGIVVINREEGSGTRGAFHEIVVGDKNEFVSTAIIQNSTGAVREAVSQDVNAIGYISLGGINNSIKTLKVNGVEPTAEKVKAQAYPVARPFNYVLNDGTQLSKEAQAFIDFILSDEGQRIVVQNGFVSVK